MENPIGAEMALLAATFLTGLGLGALYDLLRTLRERGGRLRAFALDAFFCICFAAALFLLGMGPGAGMLRLYFPPLVLGGAGIWFCLFGRGFRTILRRLRHDLDALAAVPVRYIKNVLRRQKKMIKKDFSFLRKRFTIGIVRQKARRRQGRQPQHNGRESNEAEAFQHFYEDRDHRRDCVRCGHAGKRLENQ